VIAAALVQAFLLCFAQLRNSTADTRCHSDAKPLNGVAAVIAPASSRSVLDSRIWSRRKENRPRYVRFAASRLIIQATPPTTAKNHTAIQASEW